MGEDYKIKAFLQCLGTIFNRMIQKKATIKYKINEFQL